MTTSSRHFVAPLVLAGCVFTPPPPLPEELASQEAELAARTAQVQGGEAVPGEELGGGRFQAGDAPELGMTFAEMKSYATAQGDPEEGDFTLEEALSGIAPEGELWATIVADAGILSCRLFDDQTPRTVANFVGLARGIRPSKDATTGAWASVPYYEGTIFHRVIEGFMIQGGDPTGTGRGNAGYVIPDEFRPALRHDVAGTLSMANRGAGTGSAQFFITLAPTPHLDDKHTIFGRCSNPSIAVAEAIAATRGPGERPDPPQTIQRVIITRRTQGGAPDSPTGKRPKELETPKREDAKPKRDAKPEAQPDRAKDPTPDAKAPSKPDAKAPAEPDSEPGDR